MKVSGARLPEHPGLSSAAKWQVYILHIRITQSKGLAARVQRALELGSYDLNGEKQLHIPM